MLEMQSYADFSRILHQSVNPQRIPVNGTIEVTNRCPLTCAHCYNNLPMSDLPARRAELTFEEHKRILDELAEMGCLWLLFTGGEIFARSDFLDLYTYAKNKGFLITLFTNGTLITEKIADFLEVLPPFSIEITLYGRTQETYEALTGVPGSWEKCMRGIHLLLERKLPLKLKTVAVSINCHEVTAMREFAEELGVEFKFDPMINPRIDCSASPLATRLSPQQIVALDLEDPGRVAEWRRLATSFAPPLPKEGEMPELYDCGGGVNSFAIDPYGGLTICVLSHVNKYNLRTGSMHDGWNSFLRELRAVRVTRLTKCTSCQLKSLCGSCAANGELEAGDAEQPVDFLCRTAHLRANVFEISVRAHGDCEYCPDGARHEELLAMVEDVRSGGADIQQALSADPIPASACSSGSCSGCAVTR